MPRSRLDDIMQNYAFWIFDAGVLGGNVLFPVLDPSLAFASLTAPEVSVETKQVQHGNWEYKAQVVKTAMPSSITLSRGTRFYDSDMWNWINAAIRGKDPVRRNLFMVHFLGLREGSGGAQVGIGAALGAANALASGGNAAAGAAGGAIIGNFIGNRIPGRAWVLHDCVPTRYKAGSDFDATSGAVSIQELEVQPEYINEVTVSTVAPGVSGAIGAVRGAIEVVSAIA